MARRARTIKVLFTNDDVNQCPTDENGLIDCKECYIHHDGYCGVDPLLVKYHNICFSKSIRLMKE